MSPVFAFGFLLDGELSAIDAFIFMMMFVATFVGLFIGAIGCEIRGRESREKNIADAIQVAIGIAAGLAAGIATAEIGLAFTDRLGPAPMPFVGVFVAFAVTAMLVRWRFAKRD